MESCPGNILISFLPSSRLLISLHLFLAWFHNRGLLWVYVVRKWEKTSSYKIEQIMDYNFCSLVLGLVIIQFLCLWKRRFSEWLQSPFLVLKCYDYVLSFYPQIFFFYTQSICLNRIPNSESWIFIGCGCTRLIIFVRGSEIRAYRNRENLNWLGEYSFEIFFFLSGEWL